MYQNQTSTRQPIFEIAYLVTNLSNQANEINYIGPEGEPSDWEIATAEPEPLAGVVPILVNVL